MKDTLIVEIERKLFPQLLIPLLHSFYYDVVFIFQSFLVLTVVSLL